MKNKIGIIGGGQLARMLVISAKKMGFYVSVLDPNPHSPGGQVADKQIIGSLDDIKAMQELSGNSDYITIEWEMANVDLLDEFVKSGKIVNPFPKTLGIIKDKLAQKNFLKKYSIPVSDFAPVSSRQNIQKIAEKFTYPFLLKSRFDGYDGKGNMLIRSEKDIAVALEKFKGKLIYIEKFVSFLKEISVIVSRSMKGDMKIYPVSENIHENNILRTTIVPAKVSQHISVKAITLAKKIMKYLPGAGVFAIEMFVDPKEKLFVNEIAPRVHNSGHYTIEACSTSQFEQHIRAITGLPLGSTDMRTKAAVMVNILGDRKGETSLMGLSNALKIPNVSVHIYGKTETRPDRKMGHITVIGKTVQEALSSATKARKYISI